MRVLKVHQALRSNPLEDVRHEVFKQLDAANVEVPRGDIAITAGSRGIANIPLIVKSVGDWLKMKGAKPFLIPSMGSHNGATAEGQKKMLESLGMTEEAMDMPIRASMDVVEIGEVASGRVFMDRHCFESSGVFVTNRIKLHTCFSGPVQSGLYKMMVVGMGKIKSAQTFHSTPAAKMSDMLLEMGRLLLDSGKILAGVAIMEDGFDQTAEIHVLRPESFREKEPELLARHRKEYFPRLPLDEINVLIVHEIGKTYSGTGMDTNVIGYRGVKDFEDLAKPSIRVIAALNLAEQSRGNAIGVGLADFIPQKLRDAMDEHKTLINVLTTGDMIRGKIPMTLQDDETLFQTIASRYGSDRWMLLPNTLHLETIYVSEDLKDEIQAHPLCEVHGEPIALTFHNGALSLFTSP